MHDLNTLSTLVTYVNDNGGVFTAAHDPLYPSSAKTIVFTDEKAPENFAFSCEIKLCGDGEAGMYFRAQGKNGATWIVGYFFSVNAADGSVKISKINGGDRDNAVLGHMRYPFEKGVWDNMRVEMRGTHARHGRLGLYPHGGRPLYHVLSSAFQHHGNFAAPDLL